MHFAFVIRSWDCLALADFFPCKFYFLVFRFKKSRRYQAIKIIDQYRRVKRWCAITQPVAKYLKQQIIVFKVRVHFIKKLSYSLSNAISIMAPIPQYMFTFLQKMSLKMKINQIVLEFTSDSRWVKLFILISPINNEFQSIKL